MAAHQAHQGGSTLAGSSSQQPRQNTGGNQSNQPNSSLAQMKDATVRTGEQFKESAQEAAESLRQRGEGYFSDQKSKAASGLSSLSSAIREAADKLGGEEHQHAARYAQMAADQLDGAARFISEQNVNSLLNEVQRAARRRPELFLGGMFLVGLGVSRFLKASSQTGDARDWRTQGSP